MIMAFGQIVSAAFGPNVGLLNMTHHERRVTRAMAIAAAINLPGVLVLGSLWGVDGAAIAFVAGLVCWNVLLWVDARRFLGVETSILGPSSALRA
jgi:O-antigen/teichoic acid export membrane protein